MAAAHCICTLRQQLPLTILLSAFLTSIIATAAPPSLIGTIDQPDDDPATNLTVLVATARDGSILETAPVINRKSFTLHKLPSVNGRHHISIIGSADREYNSIIATIRDGLLNATFSRSIRAHALIFPAPHHQGPHPPKLHFYPGLHTNFDRGQSSNPNTPWTWFMSLLNLPRRLWRNKFYFVGALAILFLLWFPHVFHKLPKDIREELTGEKEPDLGDPNKVVKILLGEDAFSVRREAAQSNGPR